MIRTRKQLSALLGLSILSLVGLSRPAEAQVTPRTVRVASGLSAPLFFTHAPGDPGRGYIVEQGSGGTARIKIINLGTNTILPVPFLTITGLSTGGERGLLGLAFHPNYATNGFFYVYVSSTAAANAVRRYTRLTPDSGDPASMQVVLSMTDPFSNHNGGWIGFGPDSFLYVATGDGGSANDPSGNGQNINSYLGKMLRLDIDGDDYPSDVNRNYANPPTNPFPGATAGLDEIYHYGLRNPWRNAFDRLTGQLYIADVGQGAWEEIDVAPAGVGGLNFGWRCMEGNHCTGLTGCTCFAAGLTIPVQEYSHGSGCSISGGYVYRGAALCGLQGTYFYADYCSNNIWSFRYTGAGFPAITNRTAQLAPGGGLSIASIVSFGEDAAGEMYIVDQGGGEIFKMVPPAASTDDCNLNGVLDDCDIQSGTSLDLNNNTVPDECEFSIVSVCFGDGTGTPCPCGNNGLAGNGCAHSLNAAGATLTGSGIPSVSADSFLLVGTGMPNSSALYFQGTAPVNAGLGSAFGDGLRCAGGTVIRLGTKLNFMGSSNYPEILDPQVSVRGGITGGPQTRYYQCWYRNADPTYCTVDTFNLTNAVRVVWIN